MQKLNLFNRFLCYLPLSFVIVFISMVVVATVKLNKIPVYLEDPDPSSLSLNNFGLLLYLSVSLNVYTIPLSFIISGILFIKKYRFSIYDKIAFFVTIFSILFFLLNRFWFTGIFEWVVD